MNSQTVAPGLAKQDSLVPDLRILVGKKTLLVRQELPLAHTGASGECKQTTGIPGLHHSRGIGTNDAPTSSLPGSRLEVVLDVPLCWLHLCSGAVFCPRQHDVVLSYTRHWVHAGVLKTFVSLLSRTLLGLFLSGKRPHTLNVWNAGRSMAKQTESEKTQARR